VIDGKVQPAEDAPHKASSARWSEQDVDRAQKRELVSTLNQAWKGTGVMVVAHYKGMTVTQMTEFRKRMKEAGGAVKVAKNKLARLALKDTDAEGISDLLNGQTCVAYSEDPVSAAKVSVKYSRENDKLVILGGAMGKTVMDVNAVKALADLPSLDQLRATLIGLLQSPATKIARVLMEPGAMLARVVQAQGAKGSEGAKSA
jgi:large subunit ribosomal protein L10